MVSAHLSIPTVFVAHGIGPFLALPDNDRRASGHGRQVIEESRPFGMTVIRQSFLVRCDRRFEIRGVVQRLNRSNFMFARLFSQYPALVDIILRRQDHGALSSSMAASGSAISPNSAKSLR